MKIIKNLKVSNFNDIMNLSEPPEKFIVLSKIFAKNAVIFAKITAIKGIFANISKNSERYIRTGAKNTAIKFENGVKRDISPKFTAVIGRVNNTAANTVAII